MSVRLPDLRARAGSWPSHRLNAALAALVFVEAMLEGLLAGAPLPARLAVAGPAALVAAAVAVRTRAPLTATTLAVAGICAVELLEAPLQDALQGVYLAWLFITYSMATRESGRRFAVGVAITVAGVVLLGFIDDGKASDVLLGGIIFVAGPIIAGRLLHSRLHLSRALREKAERAEHERRIRVEEAALDERERIAGELHDVVAHALGAMTIQAAAARRLATRDTARAAGAFEAIEQTGREALGELRTLLDVLRAGEEEEPALKPQPGMAGLSELIERVRRAGLPVDFEVHGEPPATLPTGVDLTAYRIVQEALGAALDQGGAGRATVWVGFDEDTLSICVSDDGVREGDRPLLGMRERVHLYGGDLSAGPRRSGGHEVRARLPVEGVPA